jgi:predicted transposase YbfD/YdcC
MSTAVVPDVRGIIEQFKRLPDPRSTINRRHLLVDIIVISICGVLAGADGPEAIAQWAKTKKQWLRKHLKLPHGIPSHDTLGRVLERLQPAAFQECFAVWLETLQMAEGGGELSSEQRQISIDGKTLRRSHDRRHGLGPLHLVSAWATQKGISLGQVATDEKSNEITAIPDLLEQIDVSDAVVTIDAMGCQKDIAAKIIEGGGDYVLALKGNQGTLHAAVVAYFTQHLENDFADVTVSRLTTEEKGHGRKERRYYFQLSAPVDLQGRDGWRGLRTIGMAIRACEVNGRETSEVRHYICSTKRNIKQFAAAVRGHWGIENTLHWSLDMTFREDESRTRGRRIADNLAWIRRLVLTLLKQHPGKGSLAMKRRKAGWSVDFLTELLTGTNS